jgi:hypothetical protein
LAVDGLRVSSDRVADSLADSSEPIRSGESWAEAGVAVTIPPIATPKAISRPQPEIIREAIRNMWALRKTEKK